MVFLLIFFIFLIFLLVFLTSRINIKVANLVIDSQSKENIHDDYEVILNLSIFGHIPIMKLTLTKNRLQKIQKKLKMNEKMKKMENDFLTNKDKIDLKIIDMFKKINRSIKIINMDLKVELGVENAFVTSIFVAILSSILTIIISRKSVKENQIIYKIEPIYNNQNFIKFAISGIFQIKVIHIINIIYVFNKKGGMKNHERTSNRRSYDYSYE